MERVSRTIGADQPQPSGSKRSTSSSSMQNMLHDSNCHPNSAATRSGLPTFSQWQARQLSSRDIVFAVFLLSMYLLYLRKTVPAVCLNVPMNNQQRDMGGHYRQHQWPTLWKIICGRSEQTGSASSNWLKAAVVSLFKAVVTYTCVGVLSGDPLHIFIPPLRIGLLLLVLVPLPYISLQGVLLTIRALFNPSNSSSSSRRRIIRWYDPNMYWHHPTFRNAFIMLQRITPSAIAAGCLMLNACGIGWYTLVQKTSLWRLVGKYSFQGWVAWLAVLPLRLHLVFTLIEWAINYAFYSNTLDADGNVAGYFEVDRLLISFVCVVLLPTLGVVWLEKGQKKRYQQLQQALGATPARAAEQTGANGHKGISRSRRGSWANHHQQQPPQQLPQHVVGSARPPNTQGLVTGYSSRNAQHDTTANSSSNLSSVLPALESLLGAQAAQTVAAAAGGDASPVGGAGAVQEVSGYACTTQCLPISIKVYPSHGPHHLLSVSCVGPVLTSALHYQLSPYNTTAAPLAITTACFQGCVQLIANVMGLKRQLPSGGPDSNSSSSSNNDNNNSSDTVSLFVGSSKSLASGLLARVVEGVRLATTAAGAAVSGPGSSHSNSLVVRPEVDVAVGSSSVSTCSRAHATSSNATPQVALQSVDPVCLIADQNQEIRLSLRLSGPQQQQQQPGCQGLHHLAEDVRLLVLRDGVVVADEDVKLSKQISVVLPPQAAGALSLALLPGNKPADAAAAGKNAGEEPFSADSDGPAEPAAPVTPAAPLLLLPLLILPAAATEEVCRYNQQLTAAAAASDSNDDSSSRAWQSVSALITDVAYLLAACAAAGKAAAAAADSNKEGVQKQQLPAGVQAVLKHLLVHLAACGMFQVMGHVVETAAAVFVAADTEDASCSGDSTGAHQGAVVGDASSDAKGSSSSIRADKLQTVSDVAEQHDGKAKSTTSTTRIDSLSSDGSSGSISVTPVASSELLWGFRDPALEARYQAAAFTSSGWLDLFSFVYVAVFSIGFFLRAQGNTSLIDNALNLQCAAVPTEGTVTAAAVGSWDATYSDMLFTLAYLSGPLPVLLLRLRVARQLPLLQQQRDTTAVLIHASGVKQGFMLFWMATVPFLTGLFAVSDVLVTPTWVVKAWGQRGLSQDLGSVLAICLKGFTGQVPYGVFWPIMTVQILLAAIGSSKFGLQPRYGIAVRYIPALALTLVVNARQQIQGRRRFCAGHGIAIVG